jgi:MoaA/NifB/PqqE/SkfB family radical SAM enzyme
MERELIIWQLFGKRLVSYKENENGEIVGTGFLNPIVDRFRLIIMIIFQSKYFSNYNLGKWHGKRVTNTFAPPLGSRAMFRAIKNVIRVKILRHARPIAMTFAVTYKCPCHCVHCSAGKHGKSNIPELSTGEAKRVIEESQKLGVSIIAFTGGEPLLRPDIFELISHVNQKKAVPILFTNGLFLTEDNVDKLHEAGLYSIFVSIDSPIAEEHDKLRGIKGIFETAIEGIKRVKNKGMFVGLSSYATRSSTQEGMYKKIHELATSLGVHNVMLFDGVPTGNMLKDTSEVLTMDQREEIYNFSSKLHKSKIIPPLSSQSWQTSIESYLAGVGCLAAHVQYYISAYGEVTPCDFTPLSFGNVRDEPLKSIWKKMIHHPAYKNLVTSCRMQNPKFRHFYIDPIPDDVSLPYDIDKLPAIDYRKEDIPHDLFNPLNFG